MYKDVIDLLSEIVCMKTEDKDCGLLLLSYADGGIENIWDDYKTQGTLDLPRIYDEVQKAWPDTIENIIGRFDTDDT